MSERIQVLLVEDEKIDQMAYSRFVKREDLPYDTVIVETLQEARQCLARQEFDIILVDYFLGNETAPDLLAQVRDIPAIVLTGLGDEEIAVNMMKLGAADYVVKDMLGNYLKRLPPVMANAIRLKRVEKELAEYHESLEKMVVQRTEQLEHMATHDQLTGLPNRALFNDRLGHALAISSRSGGQGAVLLIDMDDFKAINDAFSHDVGDEFLKSISARFTECLRQSDTVGRVGGDEFAILLENIDQNGASLVAQKLNAVLSMPVSIGENMLITTASIGISMFPHDGKAAHQLMKNADLAMYQAKESKNCFQFYDRKMTVKVEKQMELNTYMRRALEENIFELHYQPQVEASSGRVVGLEALLRLPHPERKWIAPAEFIPLAERTGLITSIDEWVLRTSTKKLRQLHESGFENISMSVNLSNRQLHQSNLVDIVVGVLHREGINPAMLELEISEGSIFRNTDHTIHIMTRLKALGVKLAIDDFGTGYASLNYLARFPLDRLKIDRSFTRKIMYSKSVSAIVSSVVTIANSLGLGIVVEGVENKVQLEQFCQLGCDLIQGYYYSPAVPEGDLEGMLKNGFKGLG